MEGFKSKGTVYSYSAKENTSVCFQISSPEYVIRDFNRLRRLYPIRHKMRPGSRK